MESINNNMNSNGSGNDDGSLSFLRLPKAEGRKSFHCDKMTQQQLVNREFWILDYDKDVKTKYGNDKYIVFIKFNLNDDDTKARKFFTGSSEIKGVLDMVRERNAFPRRVTLRMEGNNYWIEE